MENGGIGYSLLQNFGLKSGAVASSVWHDAHNIVLAGTNEADMTLALEEINKSQGAVIVVKEGQVIAKVELPIAGLLSDKRATVVAEESTTLKKARKEVGYTPTLYGFQSTTTAVIPEIRLTDKGQWYLKWNCCPYSRPIEVISLKTFSHGSIIRTTITLI